MAQILRPQTRSEKQNNLVAEDFFFEIFFWPFFSHSSQQYLGIEGGMRLAKSQTHTSCLIFKSWALSSPDYVKLCQFMIEAKNFWVVKTLVRKKCVSIENMTLGGPGRLEIGVKGVTWVKFPARF